MEVVGKVMEVEGALGIRVLATMDWGSPSDCGMFSFSSFFDDGL